ncbi:50S ribosomal protein L16 [Chlamydiales bacterium SCGC AG-110-M15]|nr:50S ribosomal protein L16 [Chlamydiales bacterium SCGC AG-110-M15]
MVMLPKKCKHRKVQKGKHTGLSKGGNFVEFGDYGMQVLDRGRITAQQIEACRIAINRYFNRKGKVWIKIFPDKPISSKPAETRMGKGKGAPDHWSAVVRPGRVLFEVGNIPRDIAREGLARAAAKLGLKTRFVERLEKV